MDFFERHNPIYAKTEVNDTLLHLLLSEPIKDLMSKVASFSISRDKSKGQDADFLLEEVNKESKSWTSKGVPDNEMWLRVSRNLDGFKEISSKVQGLSDTAASADDG